MVLLMTTQLRAAPVAHSQPRALTYRPAGPSAARRASLTVRAAAAADPAKDKNVSKTGDKAAAEAAIDKNKDPSGKSTEEAKKGDPAKAGDKDSQSDVHA
ncbi:hypothetical protein WJX73_000024 [Symbiochloris irregularis]|uniref:Uncharacterized protein n=1 Tax=Symbiochloris irregularis TaxID=706552 RepID=A0AAW1PG05_9CHLO